MTPEAFDALFDAVRHSAFRLEALPHYQVGGAEEQRVAAFLTGRPLPERSVRTNPWVARIAVTTVTKQVSWSRVRVVDRPLTDYQRFQLESYRESQAVGEQVALVYRDQIDDAGPDFWLLDADTPDASAIRMDYDDDGHWLDAVHITNPGLVTAFAARREAAIAVAVPLNEFVVTCNAS